MEALRVLVVEDEFLIALEIEEIIAEIVSAEVIVAPSVASAKAALSRSLDLALLDVDVTDGKTFEVAAELTRNEVPVVFVSATRPGQLPAELRDLPFLSKPILPSQIAHVLRSIVRKPRSEP